MYCRAQQQQQQKYNWLVFNDFHITPSLADEATELYGGQKMPCLLYYTQVRALAGGRAGGRVGGSGQHQHPSKAHD